MPDGLQYGGSSPPTVAGFQTFITNVMRVPANALPPGSPIITYAFNQALAIVNLDLGVLPSVPGSWSPYSLAVYNLAGHLLCEHAPDQYWPISGISWAPPGLATVTTSVPNGLLPGNRIALSGISPVQYMLPQAPNRGPFVVNSVVDASDFTYAVAPNPGTPNVLIGAEVALTFFLDFRVKAKLASFVPGVVSSASDVSTAAGITTPEMFKGLTLMDLQLLKTQMGRSYLAIVQQYGSTIWGCS